MTGQKALASIPAAPLPQPQPSWRIQPMPPQNRLRGGQFSEAQASDGFRMLPRAFAVCVGRSARSNVAVLIKPPCAVSGVGPEIRITAFQTSTSSFIPVSFEPCGTTPCRRTRNQSRMEDWQARPQLAARCYDWSACLDFSFSVTDSLVGAGWPWLHCQAPFCFIWKAAGMGGKTAFKPYRTLSICHIGNPLTVTEPRNSVTKTSPYIVTQSIWFP